MTTVYQVVYETVSLAAPLALVLDTTITLLTTVSTTTYEPISTAYRPLTTRLLANMEPSIMTSSISSSSASSLSSSSLESSTSSIRLAQASMSLTETVTEPGSSTSGTKLGLAIGIPLAIISLFILVALGWVFLRKKIQSKSTEYLTYDAEQAVGGKGGFERKKQLLPSPESPEEKPPRFLSRLSRMVNPEWILSLDLKLPAFMKSFNLKKEEPEPESDPEPKESAPVPSYKSKRPPSLDLSNNSLETVSAQTALVVIKGYTMESAGELTVVVGDLAVLNFQKGTQAHVSLVNRDGYGYVPLNCLRRY